MKAATDAESANWILDLLHPFAQDVGSVIPDCFQAYVRVMHPAHFGFTAGTAVPVRWSDIAAENEWTVQQEMQQVGIMAMPSRFSRHTGKMLWSSHPEIGRMPRDIATRLMQTLRLHTSSSDRCWFAIWEGWGDLNIIDGTVPKVLVPQREMFLFNGTIDDVLKSPVDPLHGYRSPNLWWPEDRSWCVATEIDFPWTYIGGSAECIALEVLPMSPDQGNIMEK
jgi:hypothetical protein